MERDLSLKVLTLATLLSFQLATLLPFQGFAKTWTVHATNTEGLIRKAVVQASPGDTLLIEKGLYLEKDLLIDKPLVIKGINQPILDGESRYEIVSIKSDNVTLD